MELASQDRSQLRKLESVIEKGIATFVEVGEALRTIRDSKLYRDDYGTFERYVEDRWQFKKRYAYNLIESAEAVKNVHHGAQKTVPANERQARELAKAPPEKQAEVWEEVVADNPNPTAKDVKAAVARHKEEPETIEAVAVSVQPPNKKEQAAKLRSAILQHNAAMMRFVDELNNVYLDKEKHSVVHKAFREIHATVEAWK